MFIWITLKGSDNEGAGGSQSMLDWSPGPLVTQALLATRWLCLQGTLAQGWWSWDSSQMLREKLLCPGSWAGKQSFLDLPGDIEKWGCTVRQAWEITWPKCSPKCGVSQTKVYEPLPFLSSSLPFSLLFSHSFVFFPSSVCFKDFTLHLSFKT